MSLTDDLETARALTGVLRAREAELFRELTNEIGRGSSPARVRSWLRALGLWFDDALGFVPTMMTDLVEVDGARAFLRACATLADPEALVQTRVALARLGERPSDLPRLLALVPAGVALQLVDALEVRLGDEDASALAARFVEELARHPPGRRLAICEAVKLPLSARLFGSHAALVLRVLLEDEPLRPFFADRAARLWLELDLHDALPAALGVADEVSSMTLLALASTIEREEAFELLEMRLVRDPFFCELLSRAGASLVVDDDRWIAAALERVASDPSAALRLLGHVGTARAAEELAGIIEHAEAVDDIVIDALEALVRIDGTADHLARVLRSPIAAALAHAKEPWRVREALWRDREETRRALADAPDARRLLDAILAVPERPVHDDYT